MRRDQERRETAIVFGRKTFYEIVGENVMAAIKALPAPVQLKPEKLNLNRKQEPEEMILQISDTQIGELVDVRESADSAPTIRIFSGNGWSISKLR